MQLIRLLVQSAKVVEMEPADWGVEVRAEAAMIHWHSPYPEVRAVTEPFDDTSVPVETPRDYFLGMCFMPGATALNTFFSPRQPAISIGPNVLQLLLAPCGLFLAKVLHDWGFDFRGRRVTLNPGRWSYKEQMFATTMSTIANGAGGIYYKGMAHRDTLVDHLSARRPQLHFPYSSAIVTAGANVSMGFNVLWQLLAGVWFAGNPEAQIIVTAFGQNFNSQADNYISDQKLAHYSKLQPRAVFRAQILALFFNCLLQWRRHSLHLGQPGALCLHRRGAVHCKRRRVRGVWRPQHVQTLPHPALVLPHGDPRWTGMGTCARIRACYQ
jgi:hypothetical protein